ncbi:MAG: hypothetical protein U1C74_23505 [Phenylobacterium sp.]|nr:hypothetical protein [Phenylobacterium sp.]
MGRLVGRRHVSAQAATNIDANALTTHGNKSQPLNLPSPYAGFPRPAIVGEAPTSARAGDAAVFELLKLLGQSGGTVAGDLKRWFAPYPTGAAWYLVSDYCLDDANKQNDVFAF